MCGRDVAGRIVPALLLNPAFTDMELSLRRMKPDGARLRLVWLRDGVQAPPRHGGFKDGRRSDAATGEGSARQDFSFLKDFLAAILSTEGDFERVLGFDGDVTGRGNEPASAIFVWGVLDDSLSFLSMLLTEGDFKAILGFVGDAILVLGTEALSTILFWGAEVISVVDLVSLLSVLSTDGDFVMVFGLDGSTTVLMGTKVLSSILICGDPGKELTEYLNSLFSTLSREGDFVRIFGLVGESVFLFDTERSLFVLLWDAERAALLFLVRNLSPEDFVADLGCGSNLCFAPKVDVSTLFLGRSKRFGLAVDSKTSLSLMISEVGSRPFEPRVSILFTQSILFTKAFSFDEPTEMCSRIGFEGDVVKV